MGENIRMKCPYCRRVMRRAHYNVKGGGGRKESLPFPHQIHWFTCKRCPGQNGEDYKVFYVFTEKKKILDVLAYYDSIMDRMKREKCEMEERFSILYGDGDRAVKKLFNLRETLLRIVRDLI